MWHKRDTVLGKELGKAVTERALGERQEFADRQELADRVQPFALERISEESERFSARS